MRHLPINLDHLGLALRTQEPAARWDLTPDGARVRVDVYQSGYHAEFWLEAVLERGPAHNPANIMELATECVAAARKMLAPYVTPASIRSN